jgi:hypothetical protein
MKPRYSGVRKLANGQWQPFVRMDDGSEETSQATRTRWEAAQLAQNLHSILAHRYRLSPQHPSNREQ